MFHSAACLAALFQVIPRETSCYPCPPLAGLPGLRKLPGLRGLRRGGSRVSLLARSPPRGTKGKRPSASSLSLSAFGLIRSRDGATGDTKERGYEGYRGYALSAVLVAACRPTGGHQLRRRPTGETGVTSAPVSRLSGAPPARNPLADNLTVCGYFFNTLSVIFQNSGNQVDKGVIPRLYFPTKGVIYWQKGIPVFASGSTPCEKNGFSKPQKRRE